MTPHLHMSLKVEWSDHHSNNGLSSIGLGFLNPTSQLKQANAIGFCMQLGNKRIVNDICEREV